ncbi:MAG TPA: hypothetical protein VH853_01015 [Polyangia bacterium]|nr:hypothetical protein [Polyangia bacterium]
MLLVVLTGASCDVRLYPLRATTGRDGSPAQDSSTLQDSSIPTGDCPDTLIGYATMSDLGGEWDGGPTGMPTLLLDGGVSGGGPLDGGTLVVVDAQASDALAEFTTYASDKTPGPLTIVVKGMITIPPTPDGGDTGGEQIRVSSNKTVFGADGNSGFFGGGLAMTKVSNVMIRNLVIAMPNTNGAIDAIHIEESHQIWIDHCDLSSNGDSDAGTSYDGLVDISDQSDFITVSWTHYHDHRDSGLVGRSDSSAAAAEDAGKEHVTYDHDWFQNVSTGPRVRFGTVHVLNNFFDTVANYGVASTDGANVRIEASSFSDVASTPINANDAPVTTILDSPATAGSVYLVNNLPTSIGSNVPTAQVVPFALPYPYVFDSAANTPALVHGCAGTGKIPAPTGN